MPGYNKTFELTIEDIDLIEGALRHTKKKLSTQAVNGDDIAEEEAKSIHDLLGRLHNQKVFYRPRSGAYISG